ncbi:translation elongation factor Ts [Sulfoacidibacillus thermotolerans]|uniref:Elongation factor Ts n=1 Tax=Sulfoacidibacillus thermotolerans TaxID=1765684 RepID=A0A2U3DAA9_SULT2|nr:translation elongation factor Ts [Sulfoacidibacillus thermotolerans]PWI58211.1 elongation factor Ts [Sulfoacidibacillus thermotolerans]
MAVTAEQVKQLREKTGAGMLDCKKALAQTDGDMEKAIEFLREQGLASAAKKAGRIAAEGVVEAYIHAGGRIGVLVEVNCETDFVAKTEEFRALCRDIAMHIAASRPEYLRREDIPEDVVARETEIFRQQTLNEGKPEHIVDKIVAGKVDKFLREQCLLDQPFVKDPSMTVGTLVASKIGKIGENISIRRFARYEMGEGLERKADDFVAEVMAQVKK